MTRLLLLLLILTLSILTKSSYSQNGICDVTNYKINIDNIDFSSKSIVANCELSFSVNGNSIDTLKLSLLGFTIDSILGVSNQQLAYYYNDTTIKIPLAISVFPGDTQKVTVFYHGTPAADPSGWGGFYFNGVYAFNMGVGFDSDPHNYGRAWFPCNDTFTDRARYSFAIVTLSSSKAFCNGILSSSNVLPGGKTKWIWEMNQEIPTYLASISIAPYYTVLRNFQNIPVEIACLPQDSNAVINTFIHLDSVLSFFVQAYGPYPFDKVGYCLIPFNSGAMEHATSIHIGKPFVNGSLTYETLWAHELSHMWWGDWATCESEGDMWLNEGFASFNEGYVTQKLYGNFAYKDWIRTSNRKVIQFAHVTDNGYLPLINIPHDYTYGPTVYNKGANVAHTLRYFMGDSAFFTGCQSYMNNRGNSAVNSYQLRDELSNSSGTALNRFFDDWVFTPGFPHFEIDSVEIVNAASNSYIIHTRQKTKGNSHVYEMPVEIYCTDGINDTTIRITITTTTNSFPISFSFAPSLFIVDREDHMSDATTSYEKVINATGVLSFPEAYITMNIIQPGIDSSLIYITHHWVAPDPFKNTSNGAGIRLSNYRYYSFDGILQPGFKSNATLSYNGTSSTTVGYLDMGLITGSEDSLLLLYRTNCGDEWQIASNFTLNTFGNKFDRVGSITIDSIQKGEYTLAYRDFSTGLNPKPINKDEFRFEIWPNPSSGVINFSVNSLTNCEILRLEIFDMSGRNVFNSELRANQPFLWAPKNKLSGSYVARIYSDTIEINSRTFVLQQ